LVLYNYLGYSEEISTYKNITLVAMTYSESFTVGLVINWTILDNLFF